MPAMASRGRGRRTINEINMVPFIDVMLVLLIIFMVTAPMLTPGMIDVPSVGKGKINPKVVAQVIVNKDGSLQLKTPDATRTVTQREVGDAALRWQKTRARTPPSSSARQGRAIRSRGQSHGCPAKSRRAARGPSVKQGG